MKTRFLIVVPVAIVIVIASLLLSRRPQAHNTGKTAPARFVSPAPQASTRSLREPIATNQRVATPNSEVNRTAVESPLRLEKLVSIHSGSQDDVLRVPAARTLATVNGTAITLKDLIPLNAGQMPTEQIMSAETYQFLLDRPINR